jgi:toxin-antitoxin system PIN domain toxin
MTCLPDVNVWITLLVPEHTQHSMAMVWYESSDWERPAFCRVTQMGVLRLLTNRHAMGKRGCTPAGAWRTVGELLSNEVLFLHGEPSCGGEAWKALTDGSEGRPNFWTDACLAAFARLSGYTLVTFDPGFARCRMTPVRILSGKAYCRREDRAGAKAPALFRG